MSRRAFILFGEGDKPWVHPLGVELASFGPTAMIRTRVVVAPWRSAPPWPAAAASRALQREQWTFPPGFNRKLARLFDRPIRRRLDRVVRRVEDAAGVSPYVMVVDPYFEKYTADVESSRLIYRNYDDNSRYTAGGEPIPHPAEQALLERAGTVVCSSRHQTDRLKERIPREAGKVFHLPHGVQEAFLNPAPDADVAPGSVCVVGSLTSRYDWRLIDQVVARLPEVTFRFVGEITLGEAGRTQEDWQLRMSEVLARPNVEHVRGLRHAETAGIYWTSAVNWMPYDRTLTFVQASSPLKLMDGLASGRPTLSPDVPECRLYPEWIDIYDSPEAAAAMIGALLERSNSPEAKEQARSQVEFARGHTWAVRARQLVEIVERRGQSGRVVDGAG